MSIPAGENDYDCEDLLNWLIQNPDNLDVYSFPDTGLLSPPISPQLQAHQGKYCYPPDYQIGVNSITPSMEQNLYDTSHFVNQYGNAMYTNYFPYYIQPAADSMVSSHPSQSRLDDFDDSDEDDGDSASDDNQAQSGKRKRPRNSQIMVTGSSVSKRRGHKLTVEELEKKLKDLEDENKALHEHLDNVTQRTTDVQKKRSEMEKLLAEKVNSESVNSYELAELVTKYTDIYADYGKCRQREVAFHLNQLEKVLTPTQTTKMYLWTMQQDKSFFNSGKSPLYDILVNEFGIRPDQAEKIQERRPRIRELLGQLRESFRLIKTLRTEINLRHECLDSRCSAVQAGTTAKQTVKFLLWISRNVSKLGKLIPHFTRSTAGHTSNEDFK